MSSQAWGEEALGAERVVARAAPVGPITSLRLTSTTWLRHAIAALLPSHGAKSTLERPNHDSVLDVDFASGNEHDRVSVSLADSELRVRLGEGLRLHCEVSSRDELDTAPELGIDLAIRYKFQ